MDTEAKSFAFISNAMIIFLRAESLHTVLIPRNEMARSEGTFSDDLEHGPKLSLRNTCVDFSWSGCVREPPRPLGIVPAPLRSGKPGFRFFHLY